MNLDWLWLGLMVVCGVGAFYAQIAVNYLKDHEKHKLTLTFGKNVDPTSSAIVRAAINSCELCRRQYLGPRR